MAKQCTHKDCNNPVFGGGYCKFHQWKRTDKKQKPLKKTPIKKVYNVTGENALFIEIWNERVHRSFISNQCLERYYDKNPAIRGTLKWHSCFAHVLPKGTYPEYRLYKPNIILVTPYEHWLIDHGTEAQRKAYMEKYNCDFWIFYELKELLRHGLY